MVNKSITAERGVPLKEGDAAPIQECKADTKWGHQLAGKQEWRKNNPGEYLRRAARYRARLMDIPFSLEKGSVVVPDVCPILNAPFVYGTMTAASIDRIDNTKGYESDNIWVISRRANVMKSNATPEELRRFAQWVLNQ